MKVSLERRNIFFTFDRCHLISFLSLLSPPGKPLYTAPPLYSLVPGCLVPLMSIHSSVSPSIANPFTTCIHVFGLWI